MSKQGKAFWLEGLAFAEAQGQVVRVCVLQFLEQCLTESQAEQWEPGGFRPVRARSLGA